jgi:hypothetical protein
MEKDDWANIRLIALYDLAPGEELVVKKHVSWIDALRYEPSVKERNEMVDRWTKSYHHQPTPSTSRESRLRSSNRLPPQFGLTWPYEQRLPVWSSWESKDAEANNIRGRMRHGGDDLKSISPVPRFNRSDRWLVRGGGLGNANVVDEVVVVATPTEENQIRFTAFGDELTGHPLLDFIQPFHLSSASDSSSNSSSSLVLSSLSTTPRAVIPSTPSGAPLASPAVLSSSLSSSSSFASSNNNNIMSRNATVELERKLILRELEAVAELEKLRSTQ